MWSHEHTIDTSASPSRVWALWTDVAGWPRWNAGLASAALDGPFAAGSQIRMQDKGASPITLTLTEVEEKQHFCDEIVIDDHRIRVRHRLDALGPQCTRIIYRTEVSGPCAAHWGAMVSDDFMAVLCALKVCAETTVSAP